MGVSTRRAAALAVAATLLAGCAAPVPPPPATPSPEPSADGAAGPSAPVRVEAQASDVILEVTLDPAVVAPGGRVTIHLRLTNGRRTPLEFLPPCEMDTAVVKASVPTDPTGLSWPNLPGEFKAYVLEQGLAPGGVPALQPLDLPARADDCPASGELPPGGTFEARLTWAAEYVAGVPLIPGEYPLHASVGYDPVLRGELTQAQILEVEAPVVVAGDGPTMLTAGQAVDTVLADPGFAGWLHLQPPASWANANLYLQPAVGEGIVPDVPHWSVELFREPRNWAIAYVEPIAGTLLGVHYCNRPCDR